MAIIRGETKIETGDHGYSAVIMSEKASEISDAHIEALLNWAKNVWDWESVVTKAENRAEDLELADDGLICYNLSKDDLVGLLGGKYGGSPGAIPGFLDEVYRKEYATDAFSDDWADAQAWVYVPAGRFTEEVRAELKGAVE